jgi:peptidoglycan/xylan/chitin deacetylase (PgdA/CDA1 family)
MTAPYPRDLIGYGEHPPQAHWPNGARVAVQFVLNYEEGAERSILHGDPVSEFFLSEMVGAQPIEGMRNMSMESLYEYGSRAGFWRIRRLFQEYGLPLTVFGVAQAMERHPDAVEAMMKSGWEIASHGYRWIDYQHFTQEQELEHIQQAIEIQKRLTGERPLGWYQGRTSPNTARLIAEEGGFNTGEQFFTYLRDAFDALYLECETAPKMMSVGLHCRVVGKPGRIGALRRFLEHITRHEKVWVAKRIDVARHWISTHPYARETA